MKVGAFNRRTFARLILLGWAGALGWLARRELGKTEQQVLAEATIRLNPEAHYYTVLASGRQVGYASFTVDTLPSGGSGSIPGPGFKLSEVMALDVPAADSTRRVTRRTELLLSRSLRLREFSRTVSGSGLFEELAGTVTDTVVRFRQRDRREGIPVEWMLPISSDVVLPQVLPYRLAFSKRLEVGRSVTVTVLDLATGTTAPVQFAATAESTFVLPDSAVEQRGTGRWIVAGYDTVKAFRIEHQAGGTPIVAWVDSHGGLVLSEAALGVRLERSAFEVASFNYRRALLRYGSANHRAVPAMESLLDAGLRLEADTATVYEIASEPIERFLLPRLAWLGGGRQETGESRVRIGPTARPANGEPRSEFLEPAPLLPPISPGIREVATAVAGSRSDPSGQVGELVAWVARSVAIDAGREAGRLPDRVLAERRAGAEGHAALFVAMTRALGLPARVVSGVARVGERIYGHAWSEVWLGGTWVAVDPTFGQVPASSRLLRVTVGGSSGPIDLVPLLGSATFGLTSELAKQ